MGRDERIDPESFSGLDHRQLDYLVELGRLRGHVGPSEIEQAFPGQRLTQSQIRFCGIYAEQAGLPVRIYDERTMALAPRVDEEAPSPRFLEPKHVPKEDLALAATAAILMAGYAAAHMSGWI